MNRYILCRLSTLHPTCDATRPKCLWQVCKANSKARCPTLIACPSADLTAETFVAGGDSPHPVPLASSHHCLLLWVHAGCIGLLQTPRAGSGSTWLMVRWTGLLALCLGTQSKHQLYVSSTGRPVARAQGFSSDAEQRMQLDSETHRLFGVQLPCRSLVDDSRFFSFRGIPWWPYFLICETRSLKWHHILC